MRPSSRLLYALCWVCLAGDGALPAVEGGGPALPAVPPDAPDAQTVPPRSPTASGSSTAAATSAGSPVPAAVVLRSPQIDALRQLIARRTDAMAAAERTIEKQEKQMAALESQIAEVKKALADLMSLGTRLDAAKKAMQESDQRVANEYQQNHDYRSNTGGASQGAIDAQASAQQTYAQLKRAAADAPDQIQDGQSRLATLTRQRSSAAQRCERLRADRLVDAQSITTAELEIKAEEDVLQAKRLLQAGGSASATGAALNGAAGNGSGAATGASVDGGKVPAAGPSP